MKVIHNNIQMLLRLSVRETLMLLVSIIFLLVSIVFLVTSTTPQPSVSAIVQNMALAANQPATVYCANGVLSVISHDNSNATMRVLCTSTTTPTPIPTGTPIPTVTATPIPSPSASPASTSCSTQITREQVATHTNVDTDCWVIIYDKVYNVSKSNTSGVSKFDGGSHYGKVAVDGACGNDLTTQTPLQSKGFEGYSKHFSNGEIKAKVIEIFDQLCVGTVSN